MKPRTTSDVVAGLRAASLVAASVTAAMLAGETAWGDPGVSRETILFIRHGEKPPQGLGQLNCQGLNRSLALPAVIRRKYSRLDAVFAPNPSAQKPDGPGDDEDDRASYDYVRPLATAEPTAIAFGLPVQTAFGFRDTEKLQTALLDPAYRNATVLVAWEHHMIRKLVPELIRSLGGDSTVPKWPKDDFDSIWQVTIQRNGDATTGVTFSHEREGLNGQSNACPT